MMFLFAREISLSTEWFMRQFRNVFSSALTIFFLTKMLLQLLRIHSCSWLVALNALQRWSCLFVVALKLTLFLVLHNFFIWCQTKSTAVQIPIQQIVNILFVTLAHNALFWRVDKILVKADLLIQPDFLGFVRL